LKKKTVAGGTSVIAILLIAIFILVFVRD